MKNSNLPPGVTLSMINDEFGEHPLFEEIDNTITDELWSVVDNDQRYESVYNNLIESALCKVSHEEEPDVEAISSQVEAAMWMLIHPQCSC